jgi:PAS domain S-box-containing protein
MPICTDVSMFSWAVRNGEQQHRLPAQLRGSQPTAAAHADLEELVATELDPHVLLRARERVGSVDFVITHASPSALRLLQLSSEDVGLVTLGTVIPTLLSPRLPATCLQVWRTGRPVNTADVLWTSTPTQGPRWVDLRVRRIFGHLSVLVLDVTRRHRQQDEFAAGMAHYRTLAENASDVVFRTRGRDRLAWVSPGITEALGYCPSEVVGCEMTSLIHPHDTPGCDDDSHLPMQFEARFRHAHGHWVWLRVVTRSEYGDDGTVIGRFGSAHDVTRERTDAARLRTDAAQLRRETDRLRALFDAAPDPHVVLSPMQDATGRVKDLRLEECNRAAEIYLGRTRAELLGTPVTEVYGEQTAHRTVDWARRVLATGSPLIMRDQQLHSGVAQDRRRVDVSMVRVGDGVSFSWRDLDEEMAEDAAAG